MGCIKRMGLKSALFAMISTGLCAASLLSAAAFYICVKLKKRIDPSGIMIEVQASGAKVKYLPQPPESALKAAYVLEILQILLPILIFMVVILLTVSLFYRAKLKEPLMLLQSSAERIIENDLDFTVNIPQNQDELGQLCTAFEKMRQTLLANNQALWRQAEERKRLNAAFAHDLRNPVTVLKGTVTLLRKGVRDEQTIDRLENYTLRIEQYIEAMGSIQRLEQMPVNAGEYSCLLLRSELEETAALLVKELGLPVLSAFSDDGKSSEPSVEGTDLFVPAAPLKDENCSKSSARGLRLSVSAPENGTVSIDHGIFLTVAENLIGNAARFAQGELRISLGQEGDFLLLSIADDGPGFPWELIQNGPKPFGKMKEDAAHFGMGLYSSRTLCIKHGGGLKLENEKEGGAKAVASFQVKI